MKTKLLLLFIVLFSFAFSCSKEEMPQPVLPIEQPKCDCVKTYYIYYPAMGSGASYIPAHYEDTYREAGRFNCADDTGNYVQFYSSNSTHYRIECE